MYFAYNKSGLKRWTYSERGYYDPVVRRGNGQA